MLSPDDQGKNDAGLIAYTVCLYAVPQFKPPPLQCNTAVAIFE